MAKKNLLYVITKLELGGAQTQLLSLIRHLDLSQYNVFLYTAAEGLLLDEARAIPGLKVFASPLLERPINPFFDLAAFVEIIFFIKARRIQIVHTHSSKAGILGRLAARAAGVKRIFHTVHGWSFHPFQNPASYYLYRWLERLAARMTTRIILVSRTDLRRGLDAGIGALRSYEIVPYAIDTRAYGRADRGIRQELGIAADAPVVGTIACFKPQKAPMDFLRVARLAVRRMPDAVFVMAGDGALRPKIERFIERHKLVQSVRLTGWHRDIPRLLAAFDVFLLTSRWEGLPISVMEAMASSLPVVATDTGGISELVRDGRNGFLAAPGNTAGLLSKTLRLLQDARLRQTIGLNAVRSLAPDHSFAYVAQRMQNIYNNMSALNG